MQSAKYKGGSSSPWTWVRRHQQLAIALLAILLFLFACHVDDRAEHGGLFSQLFSTQGSPALDVTANSAAHMPPGSSSQLSTSFLDCMRDAGRHLPIRTSDGELVAHHYAAGRTNLWNENIRFDPFGAALPEAPLILDIGGNTQAADSRTFLSMFPNADIHIYEPVPPYVDELKQNWKDVRGRVQIHGVGLGDSRKTVRLSQNDLAGQSTFIMDSPGGEAPEDGGLVLEVVDAQAELQTYLDSRFSDGRKRQRIDLLHMNCEGCEWEALTHLIDTDMLHHVGVLQVSFHNYGADGIGDLLPKYCLIREALERTHDKVVARPFGWERWVRKAEISQS